MGFGNRVLRVVWGFRVGFPLKDKKVAVQGVVDFQDLECKAFEFGGFGLSAVGLSGIGARLPGTRHFF